jgi:hypothetical protein
MLQEIEMPSRKSLTTEGDMPPRKKRASLVREDEQNVPLVVVSPEEEDLYFNRSDSQKAAARNACAAVTNCGISSFMLSAGMGALSEVLRVC